MSLLCWDMLIDFEPLLTPCRRPHSQSCNHTVLSRSHFGHCVEIDPDQRSFSVGVEDPAKAEIKTGTGAGTGELLYSITEDGLMIEVGMIV